MGLESRVWVGLGEGGMVLGVQQSRRELRVYTEYLLCVLLLRFSIGN